MIDNTFRLGYRLGINDTYATTGIHAVILNGDKIVKISKHPVTPRNSGNISEFLKELIEYANAANCPTFMVGDFGAWTYFLQNGWSDFFVSDDELAEMIEFETEDID